MRLEIKILRRRQEFFQLLYQHFGKKRVEFYTDSTIFEGVEMDCDDYFPGSISTDTVSVSNPS
jgi:hypothetical protein